MIQIEKNKLYLVTGGSGFLGFSLINRILNEGGRVRALARDEGNLIKLHAAFPEVEIMTGDIADTFITQKATFGVNGVFHLAAFKHVGLAEKQPWQCTLSNTVGTINLLRSVNPFVNGVDFFLAISTDKAAQVAGVYGASKLLMERIIKECEETSPSKGTQYRVVRYGNVLYSTGSVLCKWKDLMKEGKEIIVTDLEATRFYWTVDQAIDLIFDCMKNAVDATPHCPSMKAVKIHNLMLAMYSKYGTAHQLKYKVIGLQPGENKHEKVLDQGPYSNEVEQYTIEELIEMI